MTTIALPLWIGAKGAARYAGAWLAGDRASDEETERRRAVCRACPTRTVKWDSDFCGAPFIEAPGVSCGCLCSAKTAIASEQCPAGKW